METIGELGLPTAQRVPRRSVTLTDLVDGCPTDAFYESQQLQHKHHFAEIESFDYNDIKALPRKARTHLRPIGPESLAGRCCFDHAKRLMLFKWFITVVAAIIIAVTAGFLISVSHELVKWKIHFMAIWFESNYGGWAFLLWLVYGLLSGLGATLLVTFVEPTAGGSGIPDVKAYCNGNLLPGIMRFRTYMCRVVGLILVTSSGLFAGTEGPMAHVGAIVAGGLAMGRFTLFRCRLRWMDSLNTHHNKVEFMSLGAALGVAAAFGAPIGGLLFSLEEASSFWSPQLTWRTFLGACIASLTAKATKTGFKEISLSGFIEFPDATAGWALWEIIPFVVIGVLMGLLGAFFCFCVRIIQQWRIKFFLLGKAGRTRKWRRVAETLIVTGLTMVITYLVVVFTPCVHHNDSGSNPTRLLTAYSGNLRLYSSHCEDPNTQSSGIATVLLDSRELAIKALFTEQFDNGHFEDWHLAMLAVLIFVLTLATYGCSIPAGLFIPNIMLGACCGRLVGQLLQPFASGFGHTVNPGVYALIGATGMLAGFSRMTVSLGVIILEITTNMLLILPIMLVIMIAKFTGDCFTPSAYDIMIALKNIPLLEHEGESQAWTNLSNLITATVGTPSSALTMVTFERAFFLRDALELLQANNHHAWPVIENKKNKRFLGLLSRNRLLDCLENHNDLPTTSSLREISDDELAQKIDLRAYIDRYPFVMLPQTPVLQAYRTFRVLGLRHLCIVDSTHAIVALVTRTDLAEVAEDCINDHKRDMRDWAESNFDFPEAGGTALDEANSSNVDSDEVAGNRTTSNLSEVSKVSKESQGSGIDREMSEGSERNKSMRRVRRARRQLGNDLNPKCSDNALVDFYRQTSNEQLPNFQPEQHKTANVTSL